MSKYIPFTTEQKKRAATVDLEEFLRRRGEKLITSGRDKRLASDYSITIRGCEWFDHATAQGGRVISFVKQFYGLSYPDAMSLLLGDDLGGRYPVAKEMKPEPAKPFELPPQSESMRRVYAYLLQKRCIDREILNAFVRKKLIYESCERSRDGTKEYHNAVFVGFDEHGAPRHGHKRGLYTMGKAIAATLRAATRGTAFTISAVMTRSMSSRLLSTCFPTSPFSRRSGRNITMWPAAGHPPSPCWKCCGSSPSFDRYISASTMTLPVMPPASAWQCF